MTRTQRNNVASGRSKFTLSAPRDRSDARSPEAQAYRRLYKTAAWRRIRVHQLATHPLCVMCEAAGRVTAATVCDHVEPHRGDVERFWAGPFQSLCSPCHDQRKQQIERIGYSTDIGHDGWPTDPAHPANR